MLALLALLQQVPADTVILRSGMVITRSVVVRAGTYRLPTMPPDSAVVRIRGSDLTIEMAGVVLAGSPESSPPDQASGIGILIEGGQRVVLRGARVRGYKIGILARGVRDLTVSGNDVSHNWRPRLWSGAGHESLVDWLSFHHNEKEEWLRYGAGIFLIDVRGGAVYDNIARQGMNGLQMVRSDSVLVWSNDFSYLSGLGIGLYRSSRNTILHNRLDYCVRGYVHGAYRRGQDSAALLLYEQSSGNVVAYNSMTHSGDGVFLWAGQLTMDTGQGGSNDNLFFGNDVSYAVANGIEATFSRNRFIGNLSEGSEYGLWGGYSWGSEIRGNVFRDNVTGVAIEHGQDNLIAENLFAGGTTAIHLWWNPIESPDWGYPRQRDTRSRDYRIERNAFERPRTALRISDTRGVRLRGNRFAMADTLLLTTGDTAGFSRDASNTTAGVPARRPAWRPDTADAAAPARVAGVMSAMRPPDRPSGRATIVMDEWGPWDRRSPRLAPARLADSAYSGGPLVLTTDGPQGRWRVVRSRGTASVSPGAGRTGDSLVVKPGPGALTDWRVDLEYVGGEVTSPSGSKVRAGAPYSFSYARFTAPAAWTVRAFAWDSASDPRANPDGFRARLGGPALVTRQDAVLDYMWSRTRLPGFPAERFAVVAEGVVSLPPGEYELVTISDDGIRVWVDGALVVDRWAQHESELATAPIGPGRHKLRVEYYQVDGWVELRVEVRRNRPGSP